MSGIWGEKIKYSIFGESHGKAIGITIDGLPPGIKLDMDKIAFELWRRSPGKNDYSTSRKEGDLFQILSGYFEERTTGTPLCAVIYNEDTHSKDYSILKDVMRPGHADYTGKIKYKGFNDYRGGGHFSGRLTAPIVFAGAIAKQILKEKGILVGSHIYSISSEKDLNFEQVEITNELITKLMEKRFPVISEEKGNSMKETIIKAKNEMDSVGGVVEGIILNVPEGLGDPFFDSVESKLSHLLFSIPAVKGVEFGEGFNISKLKGSEANDEFYIQNHVIKTRTNKNGGILGGITNGMPIVFRCAFKPTPSIGKMQNTINFAAKEETTLNIKGRHDPCIVPRAVPVVEAMAALGILDLIL